MLPTPSARIHCCRELNPGGPDLNNTLNLQPQVTEAAHHAGTGDGSVAYTRLEFETHQVATGKLARNKDTRGPCRHLGP